MNHTSIRQIALAIAVASATLAAGTGPATAAVITPLNLQKPPLFLNAAVDPNIAVTVDDSGSMANAYMPDNVVNNCATRHPKFYNSSFNKIYYNPAINYSPPLKPDGSVFPNASFTAAWTDGYEGQPTSVVTGAIGTQSVNLGTQYYPSETMTARVNDKGLQIPFGYALGTGTTWTRADCTNPNTTAQATGTDVAVPAANVALVATDVDGATDEIRLLSVPANQVTYGANGAGVASGAALNQNETIIVDFVEGGGNPGGVQRVQLSFQDPNDTAGNDQIRVLVKGADRTTIISDTTYADIDTTTTFAPTATNYIGKIEISALNSASNLSLRRITRYREEESNFLPFAAGNYSGLTNVAGTPAFTSKAFYTRLSSPSANPALASSYVAVDVSAGTAAEKQNFANWYSYYRTRYLFSRTALTRVFAVQDDNLRIVWQNLNLDQLTPGTDVMTKFSDVAPLTGRTTFFQWLYKTATSGNTPTRESTIRVGNFFSYGNSTITSNLNPYYEGTPISRELSCRQNFHVLVTDGFWNTTSARNPTWSVTGERDTNNWTFPTPYDDDADPSNDSIIDPQPYTPTSQIESKVYWNEPTGSARANGCTNSSDVAIPCDPTMADVAFYYWGKDLRTDLRNNVPQFIRDTNGTALEKFYNSQNDPAAWQHVVQYIVGLGVAGQLSYPGSLPTLLSGTTAWPSAVNNAPEAVDDTWHAALNSRGEYFSAGDPDELVDSLSAVLQSVLVRRGTASAATVTSGIISDQTIAFRTAFDSSDWSGQVLAFNVNASGQVIVPAVWDAGAVLNARTSQRNILTSSSISGGGVPFRWASLPSAYQARLNDNPATPAVDNDNRGSDRVDYLRGSKALELNNGGTFRIRSNLLGAVVNSGAVVVAAPPAAITDDDFPAGAPESATTAESYSTFRQRLRDRDRVIYVGANDGMLHAFDAGDVNLDANGNPVTVTAGNGNELWAYVPYEVSNNLAQLTNPAYTYTPYVDNSPSVRDVFYGGAWHTILVGSLRRGGQGIFALDITNPGITEANAASVVRWEFSDDSTATGFTPSQLGYTYGKPNISRLANGKWVVVLPASYNSDETDAVTGTGFSTLFILDIETGAVIRQFNLTGSKGLTTPTMGDYEDDFIDEFAVAGDLNGQMWRFDLSNANPASWTVTKLWQPATDGAQPITSAPRLFPDAVGGGIIVVFGTGKYLEPADRGTAIPAQALYGVRESGPTTTTADISMLQQRTLTLASGRFSVSAAAGTGTRGWFINLLEAGERDVTPAGALFTTGTAIFSTIIPNGNDPCLPGLRGNIYVLNAATGGAAGLIVGGGGSTVPNADGSGQAGVAVNMAVSEGTQALLTAAGGGIGTLIDYPDVVIPQTVWRRRSWREIPNQ